MNNFGRGRGRVIAPEESGLPRRPGQPPLPSQQTVSISVIPPEKLASLQALFAGPVDDLFVFTVFYSFFCVQPWTDLDTDCQALVDFVFNNVLTDSSNGDAIAKYMYLMAKNPNVGGQFTKKYYSKLEKMYAEKNKIKLNHGALGYRNFVSFFSSVVHHGKNRKFGPFEELVNSLFTLIEPMVSSNDDDDIRLFSICLVRYCKYLRMSDFNGVAVSSFAVGDLTKLTVEMRQRLSSGSLSPRSANWLLLALDLVYSSFDSLPPPVLSYYRFALSEPLFLLSSKSDLIKLPQEHSSSFVLNDIIDSIILVQ